MKSPWQFGLLTVAVMGVSTYDYVFFANSKTPKHESGLTQQTQSSGAGAPLLSSPPSASGYENASGTSNYCPAPPISPEVLRLRSQQAYDSGKPADQTLEGAWPHRDPFQTEAAPIIPVRRPLPAPVAKFSTDAPAAKLPPEQAAPAISLAEPHCLFSGTLIESDRRLALVDGMPLSVGDRSGDWKLSRIESDYIILEAGKETRRIEQKTGEAQISRRREPW
jgi:hypothetical protein